MLVPIKWLKEYVDISLTPQELAHELTMHALEVDEVIEKGKDISNVFIGKIEKIEPHPNADKLVICQVNVGPKSETIIQIVTGAKNVFEGAVVPVAMVGAKLPGGFEIKQSKLRGIDSSGMLCSEKELAIAEDAEGILILPSEAPLGENIITYLGLDQAILNIAVLPNRGDCLSIIGIAREISALLKKPLKYPDLSINENNVIHEAMDAKIIIEDKDLCPRYMAKVVKGITISPSPEWMQRKLEASGIRPINNIVDITNYVLLEMGQPLHAFDYDKLVDHTIVVRRAHDKELILTLDGNSRELASDMLAICDQEKPIAVAGVMGGSDTEITENTKNILIESAYFHPTSVRRTSIKLALRSESSHRFEKGVDFAGVEKALNRAAQLMVELGGGKAVEGHADVKDESSPLNRKVTINFDADKINKVLGMSIAQEEMLAILKLLGFVYEMGIIEVPSWRTGDVSRIEDLVEDIIRIYGYENVPVTLPCGYVPFEQLDYIDRLSALTRESLTGNGLSEAVTFSITSPDEFKRLNSIEDQRQAFTITNPLSVEESVMRTQMISSIMNVLAYNKKRQLSNLKLFEIGRVYIKNKEGKPEEQTIAAGALEGELFEGVINSGERKKNMVEYLDVKGIVENLLGTLRIAKYAFEAAKIKIFHSGRTAQIKIGNNVIGTVAQVHPDIIKNYDLTGKIYYFEVNLTKAAQFSSQKIRYKQLPKFPSTRRDTTIWVPEEVTSKQVEDTIFKAGGKLLVSMELLDRYTGQNIHGDNYYNLTYALYFQSEEKTLVDDEVNQLFEKIIESLKTKTGAKFG
ncbi:MAG: phenylalanine--tRNA ligase subunit beta [Candidatus Margulisiibacteriota bacterium]|nr:MAG: phenylalanine--tRNA ligase subunit beta [Candidatus Margulisbacteria bacterium GWD2_39_127]PZM80082.1 MAG: phenylalanine--tRNA ligase subunit beta [Candidatus Margulisiibacteriota bacterium]HAR62847.1 phenylalanine--tRNA ligase subunit beta [Candidatus Margulisiibacteriota bacterium]HCY35801.1 phenylalanine--tRNA ligase subunit beta [Candidatus Margulisiibacteriota bacterium]